MIMTGIHSLAFGTWVQSASVTWLTVLLDASIKGAVILLIAAVAAMVAAEAIGRRPPGGLVARHWRAC